MKITSDRRYVLGWLLAIVTVVATTCNARALGIARDETVYFGAGARYADWWLGLATLAHGASRESIEQTFGGGFGGGGNPEHPPLVKTAMGLSHVLLHDKLGVADDVTAYRLPSAIAHGALVLLVYAMTLELWGLGEAIVAALLLLLLPRALLHAGLACFDAPIMATWFGAVYAYWRCLDGRRWPWQAGVAFGLALATKHTALLLPFALVVHYAVVAWRAGKLRGLALHRPRVVAALVLGSPLVLYALWPWLWHAPIAHVRAWLDFHASHVHYNFEYLGRNWNAPPFPWHVALVTTLFTVPVATLAAAATGAGVWLARWWQGDSVDRERAPALLLALSAAASLGPFVFGTTPIFGAEKHWMPMLPTVCIAAGVGAVWAGERVVAAVAAYAPVSARVRAIAIASVAGACVVAAGVETITAEPYALTWYNALAGGAPGGADLGMNRQFWGMAARGVLPVLDARARGTAVRPVYTHDASPAWGWYQKLGLVSGKLVDAGGEYVDGTGAWRAPGVEHSELAIVIHERHFARHDYLVWDAYGTVQPIFVLRADGVPIVSVYERPRRD